MRLSPSASCECGAASQTTWTWWDCHHQHRVSAALQARPHEPDGTVTISIVWVRRCKPDHMNLMGLSPSASYECGAASQTTWTWWDCHHQHRVSAALQARPHEPDGTVTISIVSVRRCKPDHMNLMGLSPSASYECGAASQTTWTRWDCHHQHRVSVALQARPHEPDGTVTISIVWVWRCKPDHMNLMGLSPSASCECGAASQTTWTWWDCHHQHRVSVALQARPHEPDGTVAISIVWVWRSKPDHMNQMGLSPSASCECGAARPHPTWPAIVLYTVATGTWSCCPLQHATGFATCSVTYRTIVNQTQQEEGTCCTCEQLVIDATTDRSPENTR